MFPAADATSPLNICNAPPPSVSSYGSCDGPGVCGYDLHDNEGVAWGQEGKYSTTLFTQRARKILESHDPKERPLFLLLSLQVSQRHNASMNERFMKKKPCYISL